MAYSYAPAKELGPVAVWLGTTFVAALVAIGLFAALADFTTVWIWLLTGIITIASGLIALGLFFLEDHGGWAALAVISIVLGLIFLLVGGLVDNAEFYNDCAKSGGVAISDGSYIQCYPKGVPVNVVNR